jgi:hypothetical protein
MGKLSEEQEWALVERYHLNRMFTQKARKISDEYISEQVGIALSDVKCILRGRTHRALFKHQAKVKELVATRDRHKSQATQHSDKVLKEEYRLTDNEMRSIIRSRTQ